MPRADSRALSGALRHYDRGTFRTETNLSEVKGVSGTRVSFAHFGGTGVSYSDAEFPARERDTQRETVTEWQVIAAKLLAREVHHANPRFGPCPFQSSGNRVWSMILRAVSSGSCFPPRIALTMSGANSVRRNSRIAQKETWQGKTTGHLTSRSPEMVAAPRLFSNECVTDWLPSSSREFINALHSRPQEIEKIDVLEFTGFANTQQN